MAVAESAKRWTSFSMVCARRESRALVMHGEEGVGKTALLDYVGDQATGCRVIPASGVESEMELAYAALQQLCAPLLDDLGHLPAPQRDALSTAFGLSAGPAPDRLLIGLAVLSMFSDVAGERPLVCLVDDLQWLDRASAQILAFVARRLVAESVGLVLATRVPNLDMATLSALEIKGLKCVIPVFVSLFHFSCHASVDPVASTIRTWCSTRASTWPATAICARRPPMCG